jgi:hypothetical protein
LRTAASPFLPNGENPAGDTLPLYLLALSFGLAGFVVLLLWAQGIPAVETREKALYLAAWPFCLALAVLAVFLLKKAKKKFYADSGWFFAMLLLAHGLAWQLLLGNLSRRADNYPPAVAFLPAFAGGTLLVLGLCRWRSFGKFRPWAAAVLYGLAPLMALLWYEPFAYRAYIHKVPLLAAAGCALLALGLPLLAAGGKEKRSLWPGLLAGLAVVGIFAAPQYSIDVVHQNFYLGPANQILHGRTVGVDLHNQYGVLVHYFLAACAGLGLMELSHAGFSRFNHLLLAMMILAVFALLRRMLKTPLTPFAGLALLVLVYLGMHRPVAALPSLGPLRFGPAVLLLIAAYFRNRGGKRAVRLGLECLALALAALWSLETMIYALSAYLFLLVLESWCEAGGAEAFFTGLKSRLFRAAATLAAAGCGLYLFTRFRSGSLPRRDIYLDYVTYYAVTGFAALPIAFFGNWLLLVLVCFFALVALAVGLMQGQKPGNDARVAAAMAVLGAVEFSYFLHRSHPDALVALAPPVVVAGFYWLDQALLKAAADRHKLFWTSAFFAGLLTAASVMQACWPQFKRHLRAEPAAGLWGQWRGVTVFSAGDEKWMDRAADMLRRNFSGTDRVAALMPWKYDVSVMLRSGKSHLYPVGNFLQEDTVPAQRARIIAMHGLLKDGERVFVGLDEQGGFGPPAFEDVGGIAGAILETWKSRFDFELIEGGDGMAVYRLHEKKFH